jgi:hypothetical protein
MSIEFFQTVMGHHFYEGTAPRIAKALERIADNLDRMNAALDRQAQTPCVVDPQPEVRTDED